MAEHAVGTVSHYYSKLKVAGLELFDELKVGDTIHVLGHTTDFTQTVASIHIEHEEVDSVKAGDPAAVKVNERARIHDQVFVVTPD
jgi:hypothetical protein